MKVTKVIRGNVEEVKYQFSAEDKASLSRRDLPLNPCTDCSSRGTCCGCPEARAYSQKMQGIFNGDLQLISLAEEIVNLRSKYADIQLAQEVLDKKTSSMPKQIQPYIKDQKAINIMKTRRVFL